MSLFRRFVLFFQRGWGVRQVTDEVALPPETWKQIEKFTATVAERFGSRRSRRLL